MAEHSKGNIRLLMSPGLTLGGVNHALSTEHDPVSVQLLQAARAALVQAEQSGDGVHIDVTDHIDSSPHADVTIPIKTT